MALLEAHHLRKTYHTASRTVEAIKDVSFALHEGETIGILGPSGCGKTTIGQIVAGLIEADKGSVYYRGDKIKYPLKGNQRKEIQIIFQHPEMSLNPKYPLMQSFREISSRYHLHMDNESLLSYIKGFGLYEEHLHRRPIQLSGGELQRATVARIMLLEPKIIVLDEPTSMLDAISQAHVIQLMKKIQADKGVSYIYITHNWQLAQFMCDSVYRLEDGRLLAEGCGEADNSLDYKAVFRY
ncbi:MAG: dipeptide/oligopeptide/nickel ABC transporter ATP-binding protein [Ruthenibacterium sp.]